MADIFADTIAEMTWQQVDEAAKGGAIALWALGVIEQHGPHLPAGTDVYLPSDRLRRVKAILAERGIQALIVPPFYWGVNYVSAAFPASFTVRPEIMIEMMTDVLKSVARDGFKTAFCISGHGEAEHNRSIYKGVARVAAETGMKVSFAAESPLLKRLGLDLADPLVTPFEDSHSNSTVGFDLHAGSWETSAMLAVAPELVREEEMKNLAPVSFTVEDLAEWRTGLETARRKTPLGYVGDPHNARADREAANMELTARSLADAITARVKA